MTIDHIVTKDLRDFGIEGEKVALVVKDVFAISVMCTPLLRRPEKKYTKYTRACCTASRLTTR